MGTGEKIAMARLTAQLLAFGAYGIANGKQRQWSEHLLTAFSHLREKKKYLVTLTSASTKDNLRISGFQTLKEFGFLF